MANTRKTMHKAVSGYIAKENNYSFVKFLYKMDSAVCIVKIFITGTRVRIVSIAVLILLLTISSSLFLVYFRDKHTGDMSLPVIAGSGSVLDVANIKARNRPYIISFFASWCETCLKEHEVWMRIAEENVIDLYGINYIDIEKKALEWLQTHGNPYLVVAADYTGKLTKKLKIMGVPETLIFNKHGNLLAHISGEITMEMWNNRISMLVTLE